MILKGSQRGYGQNLAAHLMRGDENEHVEVHEIRGFASDTLHMAFKEAEAISRGTRCRQYLFSLSLNPPETESVSIDAFEDAIARVEKKLGLEDQPRAIVFHEKEGRRHCHVVWSRIDAMEMKAKQLSHYKTKLCDVSRKLYLEHNWTMPKGLENPALRDPTNFTLAEWQQAKRNDVNPREIKSALQSCWEVSDGTAAFGHALQERGFYLARGDRRGFAAVDYNGEVYSLSRALNLKAKDLKVKLGNPEGLPSVSETKRELANRMTPVIRAHIDDARKAHKYRTATFDHAKAVMRDQHRAARQDLKQTHEERQANEAKTRASRFRKGFKGLWDRVTGQHGKIKKQNEAEATACNQRDNQERETLINSQLRERGILQTKIKANRKRQAALLWELRSDVGRYVMMVINHDPELPQQRRTRRRRQSRDYPL
ncbi:MAG: relaxase/mobilization nuclease domain-containing protein [Pseudomonadota bacterium]